MSLNKHNQAIFTQKERLSIFRTIETARAERQLSPRRKRPTGNDIGKPQDQSPR
ncbi:hypothetical protein [Photobacterium damselae]|uniref:hypothetical protein n=1 Tax=Photobacterium damselae TaxID=38293 RepID=UPI004068F6C1